MIPSWYPVVQIFAIVAYLASVLILAVIAAGTCWISWRATRSLVSIADSLSKSVDSVINLPEMVARVEKVMTEVRDLQEGEIRVIRSTEKAIRDLIGTIEEFEGMLIKPKERPQRVQPTNESAEITAERRRQEQGGGLDLEALAQVGKHVGTV